MTAPAAIKGTFVDYRPVYTRKVFRLIIEVPIEEADAALAALGGTPNPATTTWVALARLNQNSSNDAQPEAGPKERRRFQDLPPAQQSALRCQDEAFCRFMHEEGHSASMAEDDVAEAVRKFCRVKSRADLNAEPARWYELRDQFQAWMQVPA